MSNTAQLPQLTTLAELSNKITEIVTWTEANPVDDHVFHIPFPDNKKLYGNDNKCLSSLQALSNKDAYIAGSSALFWYVCQTNTACRGKWKPTDSDLFFLNQEYNNRIQIGNLDIVQCKEKTVAELLINFDLPVCRAALGLNYNFWISAQCVAAVYKKKQNCPAYLKDNLSFKRVLEVAKEVVKKAGDSDRAHRDDVYHMIFLHEQLYKRFAERVKKYQDRGFGINWIETNKIIPWVTNRFHYGEWLMTELPLAQPEPTKTVIAPAPTIGCNCAHCDAVKRGLH